MDIGTATASLLPLLGVEPVLGRWFALGEDGVTAVHVAVLSYEMWQTRFGLDPAVLDRMLVLDGLPYEIIGVLPRGFELVGQRNPAQLWRPAGGDEFGPSGTNYNYAVIARLAFGSLRRWCRCERRGGLGFQARRQDMTGLAWGLGGTPDELPDKYERFRPLRTHTRCRRPCWRWPVPAIRKFHLVMPR